MSVLQNDQERITSEPNFTLSLKMICGSDGSSQTYGDACALRLILSGISMARAAQTPTFETEDHDKNLYKGRKKHISVHIQNNITKQNKKKGNYEL